MCHFELLQFVTTEIATIVHILVGTITAVYTIDDDSVTSSFARDKIAHNGWVHPSKVLNVRYTPRGGTQLWIMARGSCKSR